MVTEERKGIPSRRLLAVSLYRLARLLILPLVRALYRMRVIGRGNVPAEGGVLVVSNHVSYLDAVILGAALGRRPRFIILREFYHRPIIGRIVRAFDSIAIAADDSPRRILDSLQTAISALKNGDLVVLFGEGAMSRTAHVHGFKRGMELIASRAGAPIVPAYIDGLWGSIFSFAGGRYLRKKPKWPRPVTVAFGPQMPPETRRWRVRQAVMEAGAEAFSLRKRAQLPLQEQFWRIARARWREHCMADATGAELTWGRALAGSLTLARWMTHSRSGERMMGMMMPASAGAALINAGALIAGRTPVNLNFTASRASLATAMRRCRLRTVFTSRALLERLGMPEQPEFVYLEDVLASIPRRDRILCYLLARLTPMWIARRRLMRPCRMDDLATVMFTSGSTGQPKGVMLTQQNVVSDIEAFSEALRFGPGDTMMGVLPPFHSFGFTTTIWAPLTRQMRVVYHHNPLDAKGIGKMASRWGATILPGTSSFFAMYARGTPVEQFRTLRLAIAGGQKLAPPVAEAFEKKFGLGISEGYGCTELSPVAAVNAPDVEHAGAKQFATRAGSVGRPLPGFAVRVVDRETHEMLPPGSEGLILFRGAMVMRGYLDDARATEKVIHDGWYVTADIGTVDDDGFLFIHDRVSRFSKIGGEMVPHGAVEEAIQKATGNMENHFAVVTVPDRVRGEKLAVVYSGPEIDTGACLNRLQAAGIPNLWLPNASDFIRVDALPMLANGKPDLVAARRMVEG